MQASTSRLLAGLAISALAVALGSCGKSGCGRRPEDETGGADDPVPPTPPAPPPPPSPSPSPSGPSTLYPNFPIPLSGHDIYVWKNENRVTSTEVVNGQKEAHFVQTKMPYLSDDAQRCSSRHFDIEGKTSLAGNFKQRMFAEGESVVTRDEFDQVQACYSLHMDYGFLKYIGFPMDDLFSKPLQVKVNFLDQLNAGYIPIPNEERIEFGNGRDEKTGKDRFHTGGDGDVVTHEFGHAFLHKLNPWLILPFGGEGKAIHEAIGDALSSLIHGNPFVSEDFAPHIGLPEGKESALRICRNELTLKEAGAEAHARGRSYCGFTWMGFERTLEKKLGNEKGRILALQLAGNHASNYSFSFSVTPRDFIEAYKRGAAALAREGKIPEGITLGEIIQMIEKEGVRRGMLEAPPPPPDEQPKDGMPPEEDLRLKTMRPEDVDPYTNKDFSGIRRRYEAESGGGTAFNIVPVHVTPFIGGQTEYYQQYYVLQNASFRERPYAEVLGRTLIVRKDSRGQTLDIHTDVRTITKGEISEQITIPWTKAVEAARQKIDVELRKLLRAERGRQLTREEQERKAALVQCRDRTDFQTRSVAGTGEKIQPSYVILENNNTLSYAIDLKFGIVYVPTQREPTAQNMLFQGRIFQ